MPDPAPVTSTVFPAKRSAIAMVVLPPNQFAADVVMFQHAVGVCHGIQRHDTRDMGANTPFFDELSDIEQLRSVWTRHVVHWVETRRLNPDAQFARSGLWQGKVLEHDDFGAAEAV